MKQSIRTALASVLLTTPVLSMAAGTITFTGRITDQTCSMNVEGETSPTVKLPTVSMAQLAALGDTTGLTPFKITVTGCKKPAVDGLAIGTRFSGRGVTDNGNLKNTAAPAGAAQNVEIQLLKDESGTPGSVIDLTAQTPVPGLLLQKNADTATHMFAARYYATGAATAGEVLATINYDIAYN